MAWKIWGASRFRAVRNGIETDAKIPQICASWNRSAPYSLSTDVGLSLFRDAAAQMGRELGFSDEEIEAVVKKVAGRIGDGLFTVETAERALRREFNFARYNK